MILQMDADLAEHDASADPCQELSCSGCLDAFPRCAWCFSKYVSPPMLSIS